MKRSRSHKIRSVLLLSIMVFSTLSPLASTAQERSGTSADLPAPIQIPRFIATPTSSVVNTAIAQSQETGKSDTLDCSGYFLGVGTRINCALAVAGHGVVFIASIALRTAALALGVSIDYTVVNFDSLASIPGVQIAWRVGRDLANMFFIFVLLYVAIGQILQLPSVVGKGLIVNIVLVAIFINFSLVLSRIVIDASNVVALEFHNAIVAGDANNSIGDILVNKLSPFQTINPSVDIASIAGGTISASEVPPIAEGSFTFAGVLASTIGGTIVLLVAAFVLFAAALLLVIRAVVLILLMVLAPFAFLTAILPRHSYLGKWWETLLNQAIFAPAYLFMTYAALKVISTADIFTAAGATRQTSTVAGGIDQVPGFVIYFLIVISLLVAAIVVAKELGAYGANFVASTGKSFATNAGAYVGTKTVGRGAAYLSEQIDRGNIGLRQTVGGRALSGALTALGTVTGVRSTLDTLATSKYGGSASYEEAKKKQDDAIKKNFKDRANDPAALVRYYNSLGPLTGGEPTDAQKTGYGDLSARNRAAYELEKEKEYRAKNAQLAGESDADYDKRAHKDSGVETLRNTISVEDREKTAKEYGDAKTKTTINDFEKYLKDDGEYTDEFTRLSTDAQGKLVKQFTETLKRLKVSKINDLKGKTLLNDAVIGTLKTQHLKSLAEKNELTPDSVKKIADKINTSSNTELKNYINNSTASEYWTGKRATPAAATTGSGLVSPSGSPISSSTP